MRNIAIRARNDRLIQNDDAQFGIFKLPIKEIPSKMLVWTTTPWTLSSNVALAVNPEIDYVEVKVKSDEKL